jgi:eukaryotic-like serine/threonine-protein kinase
VKIANLELSVRERASRGEVSTDPEAPALTPSGRNPASDTYLRPSGNNPAVTANERAFVPHTLGDEAEPVEPTVMKPMPTAPGQLQEGDVIAERYRILSSLATGGMGEVYRAEHVELGKVFALKVMKQELSADQDFVDRFKREAVASSRIGQHNIVDISDFGRTSGGRFYFVMEFLDGPTLADLMRRERVLHVDRAIHISVQIARALAAAHDQGIVHRDLKPENVILLKRGADADFVKVLDFGVAKVADGRGRGGGTAVGVVVGTPQYMSPEQAGGLPVDSRSDIYSLGLIAYELIAGRAVFEGETPSLIMAAHINQPAPPLEAGLADSFVPPELGQTIMRMLEKKRDARPQSMAEVIAVFERFLSNALRATPAPRPARLATNTALAPAAPRPPTPVPAARNPPPRASRPAVEEEDEPQLPSPSRLPLALGLVVAGLVVVGGGLALATRGANEPPATPPTPTAPQVVDEPAASPTPTAVAQEPETIHLSLHTTPDKAEVLQGDELIGTTPFEGEWDKGKPLKLSLRKEGFVTETIALSPMSDVSLERALKAVKRTPVAPKPAPPTTDTGLKDAPY